MVRASVVSSVTVALPGAGLSAGGGTGGLARMVVRRGSKDPVIIWRTSSDWVNTCTRDARKACGATSAGSNI